MSHKSLKKRKRGGHGEEEHANHERWMISYADMLTLLFVLFVVLFAMGSIDQAKYQRLAESLASGFGAQTAVFSGQTAPLDGASEDDTVLPLSAGADPRLKDTVVKEQMTSKEKLAAQAALAEAASVKQATDIAAAAKEVENLRKIQEKITAALVKAKMNKDVYFTINERGLIVTVVSSDVVFAGDRADLRPGGRKILHAIAPSLVPLPNSIAVDGHTNQLKVPTIIYPTAWELSTARASIVVRRLVDEGVKAGRLTASGYAGTRPLIPPSDPRSVTMNRRVDVVVLSTLTAEQRALLPELAKVK